MSKLIQLNMCIPERYRSLLRKLAAERNLKDPFKVASATSIATGIFLEVMSQIEQERAKAAGLAMWEEDNNHDNS